MPGTGPLSLTRIGWGLALPVFFLCLVGLATIRATERPDVTDRPTRTAAAAPSVGEAPADAIGAPGAPDAAREGVLRGLLRRVGPQTLRQGFFIGSGVLLMLATMVPPYQIIGRFAYGSYGVVLLLLGLLVADRYVDVPLVPEIRNARRWIAVGPIGVQPSEFMKVGIILALARYLRYRENYRRWRGLLPPFLLTVVPMGLISLQPDLGTLLMLLPVLFAMLFVAGARLRHLATIVVVGMVLLPVFYQYGFHDYQKRRVQAVLRQNSPDERWHLREGYQLRQSKIALGTGGLTGEGYGVGTFVRYDLLPERNNDFIFAVIGHQWGLLGCVLVLSAYGLIVLFGLEVATSTYEPFGRLLTIGVIVMIVVQALANVGMTVGLAPITGMTLPFVSAGGSSLWANFIALGLMLNVAQRRPIVIARPPFEFPGDAE